MEDQLHVFGRGADDVEIGDVALHDLDLAPCSIQIGQGPGAQIIQEPHLMAVSYQGLDEVRANEAGASGHETDSHDEPLPKMGERSYSTVTLLARLRGLST